MRCRGRVPCRAFPNLSRIIKKTRYRITKTRSARPRVRSQLRQRARRTASYSNDPSAAEAPNQVEGFPSLVKQPLHDSTAQRPVQEVFRERRWVQRTGACGRPRAHRAHHPVALSTRRPNPDSRMLAASEATTPSSHRSSSRRPNLSRSVRTPSQNAYNMQISPRSISGATLCAQAREAPAEDGERGCGGLRYTVRASTRGTLGDALDSTLGEALTGI